MPLTIEGGFALILTGTIVPERVVIMTTSFVYFILAVISILLCVVRHGIAADCPAGIPIMSMAVITAVIALFITSLTLVGKEGDEALDNSLEGSVKGGRRGGILLNNKLITETELAKMQQLHAEDQAHDEPIQGPYGLPDPTLPDWDGLYESEVPSHKRWPKRVFKGGRRTDKSRQRAARKTSIERRRARPA